MTLAVLSLALVSFVLAWAGTFMMKRVAPRLRFVDKPGHRKIHRQPIPLGGGVAIYLAFVLPLLAAVVAAGRAGPDVPGWAPAFLAKNWAAYVGGARQQTPMALALLAGMTVMHVMGLMDDRRRWVPTASCSCNWRWRPRWSCRSSRSGR